MRGVIMNVGIIGLGQMGKHHLRVLNSFKGNIKTISIFDTDPKLMQKFAQIYDVEQHINIDSIIESVDAIIIATPTQTHYKIAKKCLEHNKNIFIEKPMTATTKDAEQLVELLKKKNNICMIGHIERFNPVILYIREYLTGKEIKHINLKRISKFEKNRHFDVDVIIDLMIHDIDIVLSIINAQPTKLFAATSDRNIDSAQAIIQFENDVVATFNASRSSCEKIRSLSIYTADEDIMVDFLQYKVDRIKQMNVNKTFQSCCYNIISENRSIILDGEPLYIEIKHFLECLKLGIKPISNELNGLEALKIAEDMVNSINKTKIKKEPL